jgi:Cu2+-containing amine oxidase
MAHPLDPLTADEIAAAVAAVRATGRLTDAAWFSTITASTPDHCDG